ncbi:MAG: FAD-dependent oxidoreductase [Polyangiaceae bacterium]|nr:FAD-dependent oxidoreductase [Polyangiaceae bacterium]
MAALSIDRLENEFVDKSPLLSAAEAIAEANRCLSCANAPCIEACPTEIDIPTFIKKIASFNVAGAAKTIFEQNLFGWSCARVCPVEVLCEGSCVLHLLEQRPIAIGRLQRFATEIDVVGTGQTRGSAPTNEQPPICRGVWPYAPTKRTFVGAAPCGRPLQDRTAEIASNRKRSVACIGSGPASLAFAGQLALEGHKVVVFEKKAIAGGLNTTGIAPYKLHAEAALSQVRFITALGVDIQTGMEVGDADGANRISGKTLLANYDAVFVGVGLGADARLGIEGEDGPEVWGATEWIERMKLEMRPRARSEIANKRIIVVGGGNTAIDVARECAMLGAASVTMVYRRGAAQMSGYKHELDHARIAGVSVMLHTQPVSFLRHASGKLAALKVATTNDEAKRMTSMAGTERDLPCDSVVIAIGQSKLQGIVKELPGVELDARGCIVVDAKTGQTHNPKVFAGGDCVNGGKEVVNAVADGRNAARAFMARNRFKGQVPSIK